MSVPEFRTIGTWKLVPEASGADGELMTKLAPPAGVALAGGAGFGGAAGAGVGVSATGGAAVCGGFAGGGVGCGLPVFWAAALI